jgi:hypothetical protein
LKTEINLTEHLKTQIILGTFIWLWKQK